MIKERKQINSLALLLAATYMISYITRINYGAIVSEMESATKISRSVLSVALTGSFITYGAGQVISGYLGDRISPKSLIALGLIVTVVMNLVLPICTAPWQMISVWCVNGFAQSLIWPPIVKIMAGMLSDEDYKAVATKVIWGSSVGTIAVYLTAPMIISALSWKWVFYISSACGMAMLLVWLWKAPDVKKTDETPIGSRSGARLSTIFNPLMMVIMLAIVCMGMLRDGITTWMPTYIAETYRLGNVIAIFTSVILPIFSIICIHLSTALYVKKFKSPVSCAGVFFGAGALSALALLYFTGCHAAFSVAFSAILTGCMHGVNMMLISMLPPYFKRYGNVSTASGVLNSCTYIGSAISTYGIAALSENLGWSVTILVWSAVAIVGTVCCALCAKPWVKKFSE